MRLGTKINLVLATVSIIVFAVGFWVIVNIESSEIKKRVLVDSGAIAELLREDIGRVLEKDEAQQIKLQSVLESKRNEKELMYINILDVQGNIIVSTNSDLRGKKTTKEKKTILDRVVLEGKIIDTIEGSKNGDILASFVPIYLGQDRTSASVGGILETGIISKTKNDKDVGEIRSVLREVSLGMEKNIRDFFLSRNDSATTIQKITDDVKRFDYYHTFVVFDDRLNVVAQTHKGDIATARDLEEYAPSREEVLNKRVSEAEIKNNHEGSEVVAHIVPVKSAKGEGDVILGILEYHVLTSAYADKIDALVLRMIAMGVILMIILVSVLALILRREVVSPIAKFSRVAEKVSNGDFEQAIEGLPGGEIGSFGKVFNSMLANLREIDNIKSGFNSVVAHQLRTPLSGVKWVIKLLLDGDVGPLTEQQKEMLRRGFETNEKMIQLVNDLLNVSRIENGKFGYVFEENDFLGMIESVVANLSLSSRQHGVEVLVRNNTPVSQFFYFDLAKLSIAVQNIIDNAIKYTQPGGKVVVTIDKAGNYLEIKIADTGVGIPATDLPKIFSKFFRATNVVHLQTDGSGLGLFIVKNIILKHGGDISIDSEINKGTTVRIKLPLLKEMLPKTATSVDFTDKKEV